MNMMMMGIVGEKIGIRYRKEFMETHILTIVILKRSKLCSDSGTIFHNTSETRRILKNNEVFEHA